MSISPFDSGIFKDLLSDSELAHLFSDASMIQSMISFEIALAKAESRAGVIPPAASEEIEKKLKEFAPDPAQLSTGTAKNGVPVPDLLKLTRLQLNDEAKSYLHWGATSQDVIDTALVLRLKKSIEILEKRISSIIESLNNLADQHKDTFLAGRTRSQQATPITFAYKVKGWANPLNLHLQRLHELKPRLLVLSFGGAAGTLSVLGENAREVQKFLSVELDLSLAETNWHTQRDTISEFAGWLSLVAGSLGKIGQDLVLLSQTEVGEIGFASGGGSSTLPHKSNPIGAEVLVTMARFNAGLVSIVHQSQISEHERGGPGWMLEWLTIPQMIVATGNSLKHGIKLLETLQVNKRQMHKNLELTNGLILAEAAVFALARHMSKAEAERNVKTACQQSLSQKTDLIKTLSKQLDLPIDWEALRKYENHVGLALGPKKKSD